MLGLGNNISRSDFLSGYAIFTFNLVPDSETGEHLNLLKTGTLQLSVPFLKGSQQDNSATGLWEISKHC